MRSNNQESNITIKVSHTFIKISSVASAKDSYETIVKKINQIQDNFVDYRESLNDCDLNLGWNMLLPATEKGFV